MARNQRKTSRKTPATQQSRRTWYAPSISGECEGSSVSKALLVLAGGAGVGAALMYLMDPEAGAQRRQDAAERAKAAMESGGAALGTALGTGSHALSSAAESTTSALGSAWDAVTHKAHDAASALSSSLPDRKSLRHATEGARDYLPVFGRRHHHTEFSPMSTAALATGCLLAGLGAMWLFDPSRGRGRRAWIGQKATRMVNETGRFMNATGRHLRNRGKGYAHEAAGAIHDAGAYLTDSTVAEHVRSALGHLGLRGSSIGVTCAGGCISLTGRCVSSAVNRVLDTVRNVAGVRKINNEMEVGDASPASTSPNTSNLSA